MNRENFQELLAEGKILEMALQYLLQAEILEKRDRHTDDMTGYCQELIEMDVGARTGILLNRLGMMKCLYPQVASQCNTAPASVERNIRHAIEVMWERGNQELYREIANYYIQKRPSNGQFITSIAAYFRDGRILMH